MHGDPISAAGSQTIFTNGRDITVEEFIHTRGEPMADPLGTADTGAAVPPDTVVYAVGDVHGRLDLLCELEAAILRDSQSRKETQRLLIYLGDYIDRGPDPRGVIEHLCAPAPIGFQRICLGGNHERYITQVLEGGELGRAIAPLWLMFGGVATLKSYGVQTYGSATVEDALERLREILPERHLAFYRDLPTTYRVGDYFFVHAGVRPGTSLELQKLDDLLCIRSEFLDSTADHGAVVVHGHSVEWPPVVRPNRIGIDTGAHATGCLATVVLRGRNCDFLGT